MGVKAELLVLDQVKLNNMLKKPDAKEQSEFDLLEECTIENLYIGGTQYVCVVDYLKEKGAQGDALKLLENLLEMRGRADFPFPNNEQLDGFATVELVQAGGKKAIELVDSIVAKELYNYFIKIKYPFIGTDEDNPSDREENLNDDMYYLTELQEILSNAIKKAVEGKYALVMMLT